MLCFEIDDDPPVALWTPDAGPGQHAAAMGWPLLSSVDPIRHPFIISTGGGGEIANATITLDNGSGTLSAFWGDTPPLRKRARVRRGDHILIEGVITAISLSETARVTLQAGAAWSLSDPLPLRTTAAWGEWKQMRTLPLVYGSASLAPVQYDREGRVFLVADHPIAAVDAVYRDDIPTDAWRWYHATDSTGHTCAWIELATPLAPGESLRVHLQGKRCPRRGALLREPHDILYDLLADVCAYPVDAAALQRLREEYAGWYIGTAYTEAISQRQAIERICGSIGAAWSLAAADIARRWPARADAAMMRVDQQAAGASAQLTDTQLATVVRVLYDVGDHDGRPRRALQMAAVEPMQRYGRLEKEWTAPCLREPWQAHDLAVRLLQQWSTPSWALRWSMPDRADIRVGDTVSLAHPRLPVTGDVILTDVQHDPMRATLHCEAQAPGGAPPSVVVERLSSQIDPVIRAGTAVEYQDGTATFTLLGDRGEPLAGAKVILDGAVVRYANSFGQVSFKAARGRHTLHVQAAGYAPMDIEVEV